MPTKIFLSWSGELSRNIADTLKEWLPLVIQETEPFFSEIDIEKGSVGIEKILSNLKESKVSIIVLTKENTSKPWILFEAGCIHGHGGAACSLLINLQTEDTAAPLQQLQQTRFNKEDIYQLIQTINSKCEKPLEKDILSKSFDAHWANLQQKVDDLLKQNTQIQEALYHQQDAVQIRSQNSIKSSNDKLAWKPCMLDDALRFFPTLSIKNWEFYISESFYSNLTTNELVYSILAVEKENPSLFLSMQKRKAMCLLIRKNDNSIVATHPSKDNKEEEEDMLAHYILTNHPNKGKESVYPFSHEFYESYKALLRIREENARKSLDAFMKKKP